MTVQSMGRPHGFHVVLKSRRCSKCICMVSGSTSNGIPRLAIRYQVQTHGSQITSEEVQVIENKRSRLQRLIQMFEYQADSYLLGHRTTDDAPITTLGDYSEFDNVDNPDDSNLPNPIDQSPPARHHSPRTSDGSGMDNINAEDISILLHHLLDGNGVWNTMSSLLQKKKLGYAMHRLAMQFTACALPLASNLPCSMTRSDMLRHRGPRLVLGMLFIVLTPLCTNMPEIIAWQEMLT